MSAVQVIRVSSVRPGDVLRLALVVVKVQAVRKGGGRVSVITDRGMPVDFEDYEVVTVLRR